MRVLGVLVVLAACKPKQPPPQSPPIFKTSPSDAAVITVVDAPVPVDAPPPDARPSTSALTAIPPPVFVMQPRPPVPGTKAKLAADKTITLGGIKIAYKGRWHGDRLGLSMVRGYTFQVGSTEFQIESAADDIEGEAAANGQVLVFQQIAMPQPPPRIPDINDGPFEVTLAGAATAPLDEAACAEQIAKAATAAGLPEQKATSHRDEGGLVVVKSPMYRAWCGRHTKRVWIQTWFSQPAPPVAGVALETKVVKKTVSKNGLVTYDLSAGGSPITLHGDDKPFEAELVVKGALVVVRALGNDQFDATRVANRAPPQASESECGNRLDALLREAGLAEIPIPGGVDGVRYLITQKYRAMCGVFTRRVWLEPP